MERFRVRLKAAHEKTGLTPYAVWKATGVAQNTVKKYIAEDVVVDYIPTTVVKLCEFYGVDWRDPAIIEVVEDEDDPSQTDAVLLAS